MQRRYCHCCLGGITKQGQCCACLRGCSGAELLDGQHLYLTVLLQPSWISKKSWKHTENTEVGVQALCQGWLWFWSAGA